MKLFLTFTKLVEEVKARDVKVNNIVNESLGATGYTFNGW